LVGGESNGGQFVKKHLIGAASEQQGAGFAPATTA